MPNIDINDPVPLTKTWNTQQTVQGFMLSGFIHFILLLNCACVHEARTINRFEHSVTQYTNKQIEQINTTKQILS